MKFPIVNCKLRPNVFLTLIVWTIGCVLGSYLSNRFASASWMPSATLCRSSIVESILVLNTPFILLYILSRICNYFLLLPIVFLKSFSFVLSASWITFAFGDAAWLVRGVVLFPDFFCTCLFLWFCLRRAVNAQTNHTDFVFCLAISIAVGCFDYCYVLPITENIF